MAQQKVLLTLGGLKKKFGISHSSAWRMSQSPNFPKPVVSPVHRGRTWRETDVDAWVANLAEEGGNDEKERCSA